VADKNALKMLSEVPLFEGLSKKELQAILASSKQVTHRAGSTLAKEGDSGLGFFLIVDGTATVKVGSRVFRRMGPGDFFGEISLLDQGPRTATVEAETDVVTLGLAAWVFKRLIEQNPAIASKMLKVMAQRLRTAAKQLD
jgi:CRP/FNR family cyclic AMP-dependent transcriptional regulator